MVMSTAKPLAELQKGWSEIATAVNMMNPSEVPVVEGEFATTVNDWIAEAKTALGQMSTAASELDTAAGSAVEEELALAGAPTLADIMEKQRDIAKMAENGQDYREDTKELQEMIRKRNEALKNLTTASEGVNSQTESVFIPDIPDPTAPEGGDVPKKPGDDDGEIEKGDKEKEGKDGNEGENPEGKPVDPGSDRKLPEVLPKPTSPTPGGETPSATPPSAEPSTRLSSDSPAPSATPTPSSTQTPTPTTTPSAMPTSTAAQQPTMPQVSMPQSQSPSATPQAQQPAQQTPTQQQTLKALQDKIDAAKEKSEKDADKDSEATAGDTPGADVAGGAAVLGTTAPVAHAVPGAPTNVSSSPTVAGAPTAPPGAPGTPGTPPPGGVGGVGGSPAMGSGTNTQQKNLNIISADQPQPPLPTAPKVPGAQSAPDFDWNSDAVLPSPENKK